jgi:uncharacterized membrane protein YgcG
MRIELKDQSPLSARAGAGRRGARATRALVAKALMGAAALLPLAVMLVGCPGTLDDAEKAKFTGGGSGECPDVKTLLAEKCGGMGCHGPMLPSSNLDLESAGVEGRIVNKSSMCGGFLANTTDPEASVIYTKLLDPPMCGGRMPFLREPLPQSEISCVLEWLGTLEDTGSGSGGAGGSGGGAGGSGGAGGGAGGSGGGGGV